MASYFVTREALPDGAHAVHDRDRCAPGHFPVRGGLEYLGEFLDARQAVTVARIRFPLARCCDCSAKVAQQRVGAGALGSLRT